MSVARRVERASCYACGSTDRRPYAKENGFTLVKCAECGLLYVSDPPDPAAIEVATREGRHAGAEELEVTGRFNPSAVRRYAPTLAALFGDDLATKRTWLDVGCGHGEFLVALGRATGHRLAARGIEPNLAKVASARSRGLDVTAADPATIVERFDVVSLLDVYSHLFDPPAVLRTLKRLLSPGGELLLQTGDAADLPCEDQFLPFGLPDHLSFASESILRRVLEREGFDVLRVWKGTYLHRDPISVLKEVVKLVVPGYRSRLRFYLHWEHYSRTNMFIRARVRPDAL